MIDDVEVLSANPSIVVQPMESGAVLMNMATGDCFELNHIGVDVWTGLANGQTPAAIVAALAARYDRSPSEIESDVRALLADLTRHGLVVHK